MNLAGFQAALGRKTGLAVDPAGATDWINEAIQAVSEERDWPWLDAVEEFNTVAGNGAYPLPAVWKATRSVIVGGVQARRISTVDGDQFGATEIAGPAYSISGGELRLHPTPGAAVKVVHRYVRMEPHLSSAADEPLMPPQFHQAVVAYAAARVCERVGDDRSALFDSEYERWRARMIDALGRSREPMRVRVRPGGGL